MAVAGVLGGVDIVAEEKANGTLSFLLTRPISRRQIYITKIGVNLAGILAPFLIGSLAVLGVDKVSTNLADNLLMVSLVLLVGVTTTCLSGLISIFARNTLQSMLLGLVITGSLIGSFFILESILSGLIWQIIPPTLPAGFLLMVLLSGLAAGFFGAGISFFNRKEF
jgi:ABC-type transport system involved in multi-copper enzyme maturation permease subunit